MRLSLCLGFLCMTSSPTIFTSAQKLPDLTRSSDIFLDQRNEVGLNTKHLPRASFSLEGGFQKNQGCFWHVLCNIESRPQNTNLAGRKRAVSTLVQTLRTKRENQRLEIYQPAACGEDEATKDAYLKELDQAVDDYNQKCLNDQLDGPIAKNCKKIDNELKEAEGVMSKYVENGVCDSATP